MSHGIFRNSGISHVVQAVSARATGPMPLRDRVLAAIGDSRHPGRMGYLLAILRGVTEDQVSAVLDELTQDGVLNRTGTPRAYDYHLTGSGQLAYDALPRPDRQEPPPS